MRASSALIGCLALVAACSKSREPTDAERGLAALAARDEAPKVTVKHDGPTLVTVFASWCEPCRTEIETIGGLRVKYPKLRVIGINAYEDFDNLSNQAKLAAYLDKEAPWLVVVRDLDKSLIEAFGGVPKIPTSFVFDKSGRVTAEFRRDQRDIPSRDELNKAIADAH